MDNEARLVWTSEGRGFDPNINRMGLYEQLKAAMQALERERAKVRAEVRAKVSTIRAHAREDRTIARRLVHHAD